MQKTPINYLTKTEFDAALVKFEERLDQKFVTKFEFNAAMERIEQRFVTKLEFNAAMDRIDRRLNSLEEMVAKIAETVTSMNIFLKEHIKQQGVLHVQIDDKLDKLENKSGKMGLSIA